MRVSDFRLAAYEEYDWPMVGLTCPSWPGEDDAHLHRVIEVGADGEATLADALRIAIDHINTHHGGET